MICQWQAYLNLLPIWMRQKVDKLAKDTLQELRLRIHQQPELVTRHGSIWLEQPATTADLHFIINIATKYSPWAAKTAAMGYITAQGGHRIGLCGDSVIVDRRMIGINEPTSLCIRVARDFPGIGKSASLENRSVLIIGKPGSGKTTLLRDLIREKSNNGTGSVGVIDERGEVFPSIQNQMCFDTGKRTDVLCGCSKAQGIEILLRSMSPEYIAVDEITAKADCEALLHAGWCGVKLIATAHAECKNDLFNRPVYQPIIRSHIFDTLLTMQPDKSWRRERISI